MDDMSATSAAPVPTLPGLEFPRALCPAIPPGDPNTAIPLYSGQIDFTQTDKTFRTDACIFLAWPPSPQVRFQIPHVPSGVFHPMLGKCSLRLDDGTAISNCFANSLNIKLASEGHRLCVSGIVDEQVIRPADAEAGYVMFLLPNLKGPMGRTISHSDKGMHAARLVVCGSGWKITLDKVDNENSVCDFLKAQSGFGITQVGRLECENGKTFKADEALPILRALAWYISFAYGRWTGPCLPTGFAADGTQLWQVWHCSRTVPYRERQSWMDYCHFEHFEAPFPGFLKLWLDENWEEVIRVAIHWYIEANAQAGSIEGSIVLTQTAFELLSSAVLVENHGWLSTDGYEKLAAADRIRLLFLWAGIPTAIPPELDNLTRLAKADNWPDTSTAMTMIRNTITHPTRKNRDKFGKHPREARTDAWTLGLWNLELCLLRLFEYRGTYGNRVRKSPTGDVDPVPWAVPAST